MLTVSRRLNPECEHLDGDMRSVRLEHDRHICGLFGREDWLRLLETAGFQPKVVRDRRGRDVFLALKPETGGKP